MERRYPDAKVDSSAIKRSPSADNFVFLPSPIIQPREPATHGPLQWPTTGLLRPEQVWGALAVAAQGRPSLKCSNSHFHVQLDIVWTFHLKLDIKLEKPHRRPKCRDAAKIDRIRLPSLTGLRRVV